MRPRRPLVVLLGLLVVTTTTGCAVASAADTGAGAGDDAVTVVGVVDGNTIEVEQAGTSTTVTLLGLDSPGLDECLGEESARALEELLPAGTEIRLERAGGENLAAVYADEVLVNAEPARQGLGHTLANTVVTDLVLAAEEEAIAAGAGLFGADAPCTAQAQVTALEAAAAEPVATASSLPVGSGLEEVDGRSAALAEVASTVAAVTALLDGDASAGLPAVTLADLRTRTAAVSERLAAAAATLAQARLAEEQRIEAERVAAEAAAARAAADEAARQAQAAAEAEAARVAAAAAATKTTTKAPTSAAATAPTSAPAPAAAPPASSGSTVVYKSCADVRAAGAAPLHAGQPGYSSKLDRDGDGIACAR